MRIAQVAPLHESVQPRAPGATQRIVSHLTEALVEMGHEVTLFASGDSITRANLVAVVPCGLRLDNAQPDPLVWHAIMMDMVREYSAHYDLIHFHTEASYLPLASQRRTPILATPHGRLDLPDLKPLFLRFGSQAMTSVSTSQRSPVPWVNWRKTVHPGLPLDLLEFNAQPQDYFAFDGSLLSDSSRERAVKIATACGVPLRIADTGCGEADKDCLRNARALLVPTDEIEPSGLAMIEALACGTPVIAWRHGCVPEIVDHGSTGFVVEDMEQAVAAAMNIGQIARSSCREAFERRFAASVMANDYLEVYQQLVDASQGAARPARNDTANSELQVVLDVGDTRLGADVVGFPARRTRDADRAHQRTS